MSARCLLVAVVVVGLCGCGEDTDKADVARAEQAAESTDVARAKQAATAAEEGRVEEARRIFDEVTDGSTNLQVLNLAAQFYLRTGDFDTTERLLKRVLSVNDRDGQTSITAAAYGNLGLIYQARGELDEAEKMHHRALMIQRKLGNQEGMADLYCKAARQK